MAASKADLRTMVSQWKTRLPGLTEKQYLKLAAIQGGEGGVASKPEDHFYRPTNPNLKKFVGKAGVTKKYNQAVKAIKAENKVIQDKNKLITNPKKKLAEKPIPEKYEWLKKWTGDLVAKREAGQISSAEHRKQFFDTVYEDIGGADYAGVGSFQVTGYENTLQALKAYGEQGKEFAKILENDPSAINSLKKNPEFLEAANTGWVKQNLLKTGVIDKSMKAVADKVNKYEAADNKVKKINAYTGLVKDYQTKLGVTADGDWGKATEAAWDSTVEREGYKAYPTETADPMKDFLRSIGEKVSSIIPSAQAAETDGVRRPFAQTDPRRVDLASKEPSMFQRAVEGMIPSAQASEADKLRVLMGERAKFAQTDPRRTDLLQQQSRMAQERNFFGGESERNNPNREAIATNLAAQDRQRFAQTDPRRVDLGQPVQRSMAPPAPAPREPRYGGYVTDSQGNVVVDGSGIPVQYGAGPEEYMKMEDLLADRGLMGTRGF